MFPTNEDNILIENIEEKFKFENLPKEMQDLIMKDNKINIKQ